MRNVILVWNLYPLALVAKKFLFIQIFSTWTKSYTTSCLCCMFICIKGRTGARTHGSTVARWHTTGPQHFSLFSPALGNRSDEANGNVYTRHTLCATFHVLHWHCSHQGTYFNTHVIFTLLLDHCLDNFDVSCMFNVSLLQKKHSVPLFIIISY